MKYRDDGNTKFEVEGDGGGDQLYDISAQGVYYVKTVKGDRIGQFTSFVPIKSAGDMGIQNGIRFNVSGRVGGQDSASLLITGGKCLVMTGTDIVAEHGVELTGGVFKVYVHEGRHHVGITGNMYVEGGEVSFTERTQGGLVVTGDIYWNKGLYAPRFYEPTSGVRDSWVANGKFYTGTLIELKPIRVQGEENTGTYWQILRGDKGFIGGLPDLPAALDAFEIKVATIAVPPGGKGFDIVRKENP